tara:strand:+ start:10345 stop:11295 length:951 start_codon:yes stop_codon:yes gene_type:complete
MRDVEILTILKRYRFLRSTTIWQLLPEELRGRSFKRFQDRLTDLFHETHTQHAGAYLDWPSQQRQSFDARYSPSIYALSDVGKTALDELGIEVDAVTNLRVPGNRGNAKDFAHMLMICDTLASIEIGTKRASNIRFIPWPEILRKAPLAGCERGVISLPVTISNRFSDRQKLKMQSFNLEPDGLFGLEYKQPTGRKLYRFFALEAERRNKVRTTSLKGSSYLKKILAYRYILESEIYKTELGLPNLLILTVTPNNARIRTMKEAVTSIYGPKGSANFLFHSIPVHGEISMQPDSFPDLFAEPWERAGYAPFYVNLI